MHIYIPNVGKHQGLCFHLTSHTAYNDPSYPLQKIISSIINTTAWLAITYVYMVVSVTWKWLYAKWCMLKISSKQITILSNGCPILSPNIFY